MMLFSYDQSLLQMLSSVTKNGREVVWVIGSPIEGEDNEDNLPKDLVLVDGGGCEHWEAYYYPDTKEIEVLYNDSF